MNNNFGEYQIENDQYINAIELNNNQNNNNNQNIQNNRNNNIFIFNIFVKYPDITISYPLFFIVNIILLINSSIFPIEPSNFVFQYGPIISKNQLYRMITRYFIHFGFAHLILEQISFFYLCKYFENKFGTLLTISIIFIGMILDSIINIILILFYSLFWVIVFLLY